MCHCDLYLSLCVSLAQLSFYVCARSIAHARAQTRKHERTHACIYNDVRVHTRLCTRAQDMLHLQDPATIHIHHHDEHLLSGGLSDMGEVHHHDNSSGLEETDKASPRVRAPRKNTPAHSCEICAQTFTNIMDLKKHWSLLHSGTRPVVCGCVPQCSQMLQKFAIYCESLIGACVLACVRAYVIACIRACVHL